MKASRFLSYIYTYCNIKEVMLSYLPNGTNSAKESDIQTKRIRTSAERLGIGKETECQGVGMVVLQSTVQIEVLYYMGIGCVLNWNAGTY